MDGKVIIIGGGLAGLFSAIQLQQHDIPCLIIEKKRYPFHRVCGEYISNEARPFLEKISLFPNEIGPTSIGRLQLTAVNGKSATMPLALGGFGVSRFYFDNYLYNRAKSIGVEFLFEEVQGVSFKENLFTISLKEMNLTSHLVIAAYGKRSLLDIKLQRKFVKKRSPFVGIKYHIKTNHPVDLIGLHNFYGGYCGISNVENGITNLCYLTSSNQLKENETIKNLEKNVLYKNPVLKNIFLNADFLLDKPEVISEISFETKAPVENHMLMVGDAAGMITPLAGNGMAMAIHSSKIVCNWVLQFKQNKISRDVMEKGYQSEWNLTFKKRLQVGRQVQRFLFGTPFASTIATGLIGKVPPLRNYIIKQTHGNPF